MPWMYRLIKWENFLATTLPLTETSKRNSFVGFGAFVKRDPSHFCEGSLFNLFLFWFWVDLIFFIA